MEKKNRAGKGEHLEEKKKFDEHHIEDLVFRKKILKAEKHTSALLIFIVVIITFT